jgi:hypothetical protein
MSGLLFGFACFIGGNLFYKYQQGDTARKGGVINVCGMKFVRMREDEK